MESIKHKMDTMVKENDAAIEKAVGFEVSGPSGHNIENTDWLALKYADWLVFEQFADKWFALLFKMWFLGRNTRIRESGI